MPAQDIQAGPSKYRSLELIGSRFRVWGYALRATTPQARFKGYNRLKLLTLCIETESGQRNPLGEAALDARQRHGPFDINGFARFQPGTLNAEPLNPGFIFCTERKSTVREFLKSADFCHLGALRYRGQRFFWKDPMPYRMFLCHCKVELSHNPNVA